MTRKELTDLGLEKDVIDAIMKMNGESVNALKEQLAEKDKAISELTEKAKNLQGNTEEIEKLQATIKQFEVEAEERKKQAEAQIVMDNISKALEGKEFVNELTRNGIIAQIKTEIDKTENKGKGIADIFEAITKDKTDIFKNPQEKIIINKAGNVTQSQSKAMLDEYYKDNPFYKG